LPPRIDYADANAQGTDPETLININLHPCLYVLNNLAPASMPESFAADCGGP
jgi:hypothetical protein